MEPKEMMNSINQRSSDQVFIKWWRREEDFLDFELVDKFIADFKPDDKVGGFQLMTMDEVWNYLQNYTHGRNLRRMSAGEADLIEWEHKGTTQTCPFTPEALMTILDTETRGNPVDGA